MPEIIYGISHSEREELLFSRIKQAAQSRETLVIIPDQYSSEFDKRLYTYLGAALFNTVHTMGVARLCDKICRTGGGRALENADENMKLIAMYNAQTSLRASGSLDFYKKSLLRPSFVSECISLYQRMLKAGATPELLRAAAELKTGSINKLSDLSKIFSEYEKALAELGMRDSISQTALAARLAGEKKYFSGKYVFFEAFTSFSADELSLIKSVVKGAAASVFSLVCDEFTEGQNPFAETIRTRTSIEKIACDCNLKVKYTHAGGCAQTAPLAHINKNLGKYRFEKIPSQQLVKVVSASDIYEESEYVCAEISRLVREGARYSEIAVVCGGLAETSQILSGVAERYEIPYFIDMKKSALTSVPAKYLLSILDAAMTRELSTENILRIVKSPLSPVLDYDACDLEDFCIKWNVSGDMWLHDFAVSERVSTNGRLDETRKRIAEPIVKFKSACVNATAGEICSALFTLLDELEMPKQVYSAIKGASSENETELEISRSFKQVWLGIVGAVKAVYDNMTDRPMSLRAFSELIRLMLDGISLSAPPQKSDCVRVADASRSRISGVKTLFIMQANEKLFPRGAQREGLLSDGDIRSLADLGAELDCSARMQIDGERMSVYSAVTAPSERLYICWSESDRTGAVTEPSPLAASVCALFEDDISLMAADMGQEFYCTSYRTAYYSYLGHSKDNTTANASVRESLKGSPDYERRLEYIHEAARARPAQISGGMAKRLFYPSDMNLSATRVSDYYKCPFSYFCKHGLKLYPTNAVEINPQYEGSIAHSCLEYVMICEKDGSRVYNPHFTSMTDGQLAELINRRADEYVENEMGGSYGKDLRFASSIERLKDSVLSMAVNFREEMKNSLFVPAAFEYDLTDDNGKPVLEIAVDDEVTVRLRGKVDRADIYDTPQGRWLRIVDYKTGGQTFREAEVYHGLNMQMLIYLLALTSSESPFASGGVRPAGIMYSHIRFVRPTLTAAEVEECERNGELEERLRLERAKSYKPDGMMQGGQALEGMNREYEGVYTVFRLKKDGTVHGSSTVKPSEEQRIVAMEKYALDMVTKMAKALRDGKIGAKPIETESGVMPCTYCDYRAMCADPLPKNHRVVSPEDMAEFDMILEDIAKKGESGNGGGKVD